MARERPDVDVIFRVLDTNGSVKKEHYFQNLPLPLDIHDLDERLKNYGLSQCIYSISFTDTSVLRI